MKKLLLGLALTAGTLTLAQKKASSSPIGFGAKAGLNISSLSEDNTKAKAGFYGGVFANIPIAEEFSIQPELMYNALGGKDKESNIKINLDYLSVPVMLQYKALPNLYLEAGPQFSFLLSSKIKSDSESINTKEHTSGFDFGLGIGAGYYFTQNIGVNARYVAGLTDISKNRITGDAVRNGAFQLGLSYKFK